MLLDSTNHLRIRIEAGIGMFATAFAIFIGIWPSPLTIVAILVLPASLIFLRYVFAPSGLDKHPHVRYYLIGAACLSIGSILFEGWWLATYATFSLR